MGRTLRKNLKDHQLAPFMTYLFRRWKRHAHSVYDYQSTLTNNSSTPMSVSTQMSVSSSKSWADLDGDDDLPSLSEFVEATSFSPPKNPWTHTNKNIISFIHEYNYKNK